jgi:uncharacterized protein (DUF1330 family)
MPDHSQGGFRRYPANLPAPNKQINYWINTMKRYRFESFFAIVLLALYAAFFLWQTPGLIHGKLTAEEIDGYLKVCETSPSLPETDRSQIVHDLREWALKDDGQPLYMLNLLRNYPELRPYPGAPDMTGLTPEQANAYYEANITKLAFKNGAFPIFMGPAQGNNVVGREPDADNWSRVIVMRYPARRSVLALFCSPEYLPFAPYKLASLKVNLVPTSAELVLADLRVLLAGVLLILFFAVSWLRGLRHRTG